MRIVKGFVAALLLVGGITIIAGAAGGLGKDHLSQAVQEDVEGQYQILVDTNAPAMERCVRAGLVKESYLQGHDTTGFRKWANIEKADCRKAGL